MMEEGTATAAVPQGLGPRAVELLGRLIQTNTVNPPGNEGPIQDFLQATLTDAGFECEQLSAEPGRPNLVARLRGASDGPTLTFLGQVDTVRADPDEWSFDPWAGDVSDGSVRGRGALDMKGQVASEVAAAATLAESGWRPWAGGLLLGITTGEGGGGGGGGGGGRAGGERLRVITAEGEGGGGLGAMWLCAERADVVRSDFVVNEGGG